MNLDPGDLDTSVGFATRCINLSKPLTPLGPVSFSIKWIILIFFYSNFHPGLTFTDLFLECTLTLPLKCSHYVFFFFSLNQKWGLWSNRWFSSGQIWDCLEESRWLMKLFLGHFLVHVHNFENSNNLKCWVNNKDFWRE